ncbi:MAG: hypothetical protein H6739_27195 [Alphaproteobacteria bacterium]|nr:hypothetical protein [Alphaproteobacteria bacterium]
MSVYLISELGALPDDVEEVAYRSYGSPSTFGDASIKQLKRLRHLRTLRLGSAKRLTDAGLRALVAVAPALETLELGDAYALTEAGLAALADLPLRSLTLWRVPALTSVAPLRGLRLRHLRVGACYDLDAPALTALEHFEDLESVELFRQRVTTTALQALSRMPRLRALQLNHHDDTMVRRGVYAGLAGASALERLAVSRPLSRAEAEALAGLPRLQALSLKVRHPRDVAEQAPLGALGGELHVEIDDALATDDRAVRALPDGLPGVTALEPPPAFDDGFSLTRASVSAIARLRHLRWLDLGGHEALADRSLWPLTELDHLTALGLSSLPGLTPKVTGILANMPSLKELDLSWCALEPDALGPLLASSVERLSVGGCEGLGSAGVGALAGLRSLKGLGVRGIPLEDDALERLGGLPALEHLLLDLGAVSAAGFTAMGRAPALQQLDVMGMSAPLTDAMLAGLAASPTLKTLAFAQEVDASAISDDALRALRVRALEVSCKPTRATRAALRRAGTFFTNSGEHVGGYRALSRPWEQDAPL